MEEKTFYNNGSVSVTQSRFIVGRKTFAMRNISSVQNVLIDVNRTPGVILCVMGILVALIQDARICGIIIALIAGLYTYLLKNKYSVRITTNSGATDGLISENREYIQQIVDALNEAITHQG